MKPGPYLKKLERQIAADERGSIVHRWEYGQALLALKGGGRKLPDGLLDALVKEAQKDGLVLSRQEIQRRIRCAEAYKSRADCVRAGRNYGSWSALRDAGFPPVEPDGTDPDDLDDDQPNDGFRPNPAEDQLALDLPGLKPVLTIRHRQVPVVRSEGGAKAADIRAYLDMCREKHTNYGKTVDRIAETFAIILDGCGGDESMNAVLAYERGLALEAGDGGCPISTDDADPPVLRV